MIPFPEISPNIISFSIGGSEFALRWYAVSYIMGFVVAGFLMKYFIRKNDLWLFSTPPMEKDQAEGFITFLILGVIIGGRLGYVLFYNLGFYLSNPIDTFKVWDGGMSFHGGFLGVVISVILFCRFNGIPLWSCSDMVALATPPGLFFGRVANFINAELWGRPTDAPWGVIFPLIDENPRHPSQLYEALLEGIILFFILRYVINRKGYKIGNCSCVFLIGYGLFRIISELFREPDAHIGYLFSLMSTGTLLSIIMIFSGLILFNFLKKNEK